MNETVTFPNRGEYSAAAENVELNLLIDYRREDIRGGIRYMHSHTYTELFCCRAGELELETPAGILVLSPGEMAIIPPHCGHRIHAEPEAEDAWCAIGVSLLYRRCRSRHNLWRLLSGLCLGTEPLKLTVEDGRMEQVFRLCADRPDRESPIPALQMISLLSELAEIHLPVRSTGEERQIPEREIKRIAQLEHIVANHYREELTACQIAGQLYISERQLERIAVRCFGMPLHRAILAKRIEVAAGLLTDTELSVEEIGEQVGFSSKSCFNRTFRARLGMTPREYRCRNPVMAADPDKQAKTEEPSR